MGRHTAESTIDQSGKVVALPGVDVAGEEESDSGPLSLGKPFVVWRWLRDKCDWPPNVKLAYWVIYTHRNRETGQTCPSLAKVAKGMGCTPKATIAAIQVLEHIGALTVIRRKEPDSKEAAVNLYDLRAPWEAEQRLKRAPRGKQSPKVVSNGKEVVSKGNNVVSDGQEVVSNTPEGTVKTTQRVVSNRHSKEIDTSNGTSNGLLTSPTAAQPEKPPRKKRTKTEPQEPPQPKERDQVADDAQTILARFHDLRIESGAEGISHEGWGGAKNTVKNVIKGKAGAADIPVDEACAALEWAFYQNPEELTRLTTYGLKSLRSVWDKYKRRGKAAGRPGERVFNPVDEINR